MKEEIEIRDADYGFTWCSVEDTYFLRTEDNDFREVNRAVIDLLKTLAKGELTKTQLKAQIEGGETVIAEESPTTAKEVLQFVENYLKEGVIHKDGSVVRLIPPKDIRLWPRLLAFLVPLSIVSATVVNNVPKLQETFTHSPSLWTVAAVMILGYLFLGVHEYGHYAASTRHFDSSIRVDLVNGIVPAVVTDTTGSWMLPQNRRIWINLAGPLLELSMVVPFTLLYYSHPEIEFLLLLNAVVLAHTIFSLNPLIHGDGFWIMCDFLGLVNVRSQGIEDIRSREVSWRAIYVIASYGFGGVVVFNSVILTIYSMGVKGVAFVIPVLLLYIFSKIDYRVKPDWV